MFEKKTIAKSILVADDEKDTCLFIKRILERRKYKVSLAYDGTEAQKLLEKNQFNFAFLDCSMPGLAGFELIKVVREKNPQAKVFIFSGYAAINDRLANDLGADEFLQKPLSVERIEEILKKYD